jgi:ABC-type Zn uptake system ZnuABC Zn-binding protein ZnuA
VQQVGREAGVRVVDDLYGDSLGSSGSDGATYIEMMQSNTRKIVEALKDCGG